VKQRGAADAGDGRTHFLGVDDLQPKRVRHATTETESAMSEWREEKEPRFEEVEEEMSRTLRHLGKGER
jgi:hypothetical protein